MLIEQLLAKVVAEQGKLETQAYAPKAKDYVQYCENAARWQALEDVKGWINNLLNEEDERERRN